MPNKFSQRFATGRPTLTQTLSNPNTPACLTNPASGLPPRPLPDSNPPMWCQPGTVRTPAGMAKDTCVLQLQSCWWLLMCSAVVCTVCYQLTNRHTHTFAQSATSSQTGTLIYLHSLLPAHKQAHSYICDKLYSCRYRRWAPDVEMYTMPAAAKG